MIRKLLDSDEPEEEPAKGPGLFTRSPEVTSIMGDPDEPAEGREEAENADTESGGDHKSALLDYTPPTAGEAMRMTGLAWSAGITLFASIVFMLVVGWLADLLLGTAPWGIVVGIVVGSIIGFVQFFRINSEILKTPGRK
jgi:F0F1-type ATP synthase assembly protein I